MANPLENELFTRLQDRDQEIKKLYEDRKRYMDRVEVLERENKRLVGEINATKARLEAMSLAVAGTRVVAALAKEAINLADTLLGPAHAPIQSILGKIHAAYSPINHFLTLHTLFEEPVPTLPESNEEPASTIIAKVLDQNGTEP